MPRDSGILKVGVIGCGLIAETQHLPTLLSMPAVRVVATADSDADRLKRVSDRFHISARYSDYHALLANAAIDAVVVCAPVQFHAPIVLAALDAGKHVLVEKPLALSVDECRQIAERAARSATLLMVGFNLRWHRITLAAHRVIESGALGRIEAVRSVISSRTRYRADAPEWWKSRRLGGGTLIEQGVHHYDLWRFLLAKEVDEICAISRSGDWQDEVAAISGRMTNGTLVSALFTIASSSDNQIEIFGEKGRLSISLYRFDGLHFLPAGSLAGDLGLRVRHFAESLRGLGRAAPILAKGGDWAWSFRNEWQHFVNAIQKGEDVGCTVEDGVRAAEIVAAVVRSVEGGTPVRVETTGVREKKA
jgi:myo-inositol 2-dehydrogenase / D-chiro-inositol 1-dehydrogenase